jgi:hypothetical protein
VGFVDCLTTMLDESIPLTIIEREEWGDPLAGGYMRVTGWRVSRGGGRGEGRGRGRGREGSGVRGREGCGVNRDRRGGRLHPKGRRGGELRD